MNVAMTRLLFPSIAAAITDDNIELHIKRLADRIFDDEDWITDVWELEEDKRTIYQLDSGAQIILDQSGDINTLEYKGKVWEEMQDEDMDCDWAVEQKVNYNALRDCTLYLLACMDEKH